MDNNTKPYVYIREDLINTLKKYLLKDTNNKVICLQGKTGSGKSKTLNYISDNPEFIGEKTIVVYINLKECNLRDYNIFSKCIFSKIKGKLSEYKIKLNNNEVSLDQHTTHGEINILYKEIQNQLGDKQLLLILDESQLLLHVDNDILDKLYLLINVIQDSCKKTKWILASDSHLCFPQNPELRAFFQQVPIIVLDEIPIEQLIEIIEKNSQNVTLAADTVEEILKISGNNPYILETIVLKYLNKYAYKPGIEIHVDTINKIAQEIVNDPQPEFNHAWNHKMDWEHQIVLSALADPGITKKYQDSTNYFLEFKLLEIIFGKNEVASIFSDLIANDIIFKEHEYKFDAYPFKSHLLGRWVEKNHRFNQTVHGNFHKIVEKTPLSRMYRLLDALPAESISSLKDLGKLKKICSVYNNFLNSNNLELDRRKKAAQFVKSFFTNLLNFETGVFSGKQDMEYMMVDIEKSALGMINMLRVFFQNSFAASPQYINWIKEVHYQNPGIVSLLFYFKKDDGFEELTKEKYCQIITFKEADIKKILISPNSREEFKKYLIEHIHHTLINPYNENRIANEKGFFGRHKEIGRILTTDPDSSFFIVGPRKIGKTSLLFEINNLIEKRMSNPCENNPSICRPLYLDLQSSKNYNEFLSKFTYTICKVYNMTLKVEDFKGFESAIYEVYKRHNQRICIIIDEVDELLKFDRGMGYKLFGLIQSLSKEYCRFIIAGWAELFHDKKNADNSPLWKFGSQLMLRALDIESAKPLITDPMVSIGIHRPSDNCIHRILEISACQPCIIQFICRNLIEHLYEKDKKTIELDDVEFIYNSKCKKFILNKIIMFYSAPQLYKPIEKLIVFVMIDMYLKKNKNTKIIDLQKELRNKYDIHLVEEQLYYHLQNLEIRNVLIFGENNQIHFALPILPNLFQEKTDLEREKNELLKELKKM